MENRKGEEMEGKGLERGVERVGRREDRKRKD